MNKFPCGCLFIEFLLHLTLIPVLIYGSLLGLHRTCFKFQKVLRIVMATVRQKMATDRHFSAF